MEDISSVDINDIIDSLSDGVYVCDLEDVSHWLAGAEHTYVCLEAESEIQMRR